MDASVVIGQPNFTSAIDGSLSPSSTGLSTPIGIAVVGGKLVVSDYNNNRVLIYNFIPTSSNQPADVVIGQPNMTSNSPNQGGSTGPNTLSSPGGIDTDGTKLFIVDYGSSRVLIYNHLPTTNNASADLVIGQSSMTANSAPNPPSSSSFVGPWGVSYDESTGKLAVADYDGMRVLIYNSVPTANGVAADMVVGQPDFASTSANQGGSPAANTINVPNSVRIFDNHLFIADQFNHRVLVYNSVPTTNNASADVVIGQANFTSSSLGTSANTFWYPSDTYFDGKRLFVKEAGNGGNSISIFDGIPSTNNASAYMVLGQPDFTSNSTSPVTASSVGGDTGIKLYGNKLIVSDTNGNRVLIFDNIVKDPQVTFSSPELQGNGKWRVRGRSLIDGEYVIRNVMYSVNGGGFNNASPKDGAFDSISEDFFFDFTESDNDPRDSKNNKIPGYTLRVKSQNTNSDITDNSFFFTPFTLNSPNGNTASSIRPSISFSINKQRSAIKDNVSKFRVMYRADKDKDKEYKVYADDVPVDFSLVQREDSNKRKASYINSAPDNGTGTFETDKILVNYKEDSSILSVSTKTSALKKGETYSFKVQAVDKTGRVQDSNGVEVIVSKDGKRGFETGSGSVVTPDATFFPLTLTTFGGLPKKDTLTLSSLTPSFVKEEYSTSSLTPTIQGIAYSNAKVTVSLTDEDGTTKTVETTSSPASFFSLQVPPGVLVRGKEYSLTLEVRKDNLYTQIGNLSLTVR
ncbi:MAG: hypothetical protein Q7S79_00135 [bacterium]|nr:hypothetical protein [bacterium]